MEDVLKSLKLKSNSKIYIFTPAYSVSGGPEALHQLGYYMRKCGLNAYNVYYGFVEGNPTPQRYEQYNPSVLLEKDIIDDKNNIIIMPESATYLLINYRKTQKCIWWLSVIFYDGMKAYDTRLLMSSIIAIFTLKLRKVKSIIWEFKRRFAEKGSTMFVGSQYAYDYLTQVRKLSDIKMLVEPISKNFLDVGHYDSIEGREDIIVYNPAKPSKIMDKLLEDNKFKFVPIKNMTPLEIAELLKKAKLYVDFGHFGGPERIPKEAVYNGCAILVANHNAAVNDFDIAIPARYKIDNFNDLETVTKEIEFMLTNYERVIQDFKFFQNKVINLEKGFIESIKSNFEVEE